MKRHATEISRRSASARCKTSARPSKRSPAGSARRSPPARAGAFGSKVVILDEPTAALGVRESNHVLNWSVICATEASESSLSATTMPQVFDVADRLHIQRLPGRCAGVVTPQSHSMEDAVAIMTGAKTVTMGETTGHRLAPERG